MITFYKGEDFTLTFTSTQDISGYTKSVSYFTPFGTPVLAVVTPINNFSFSAKFASTDTATLKAGALNVVVTFTDVNNKKIISKAMPAQIVDPLVNGNLRTSDIPSTSLEIVFEQNTIALDINFVGLTNTQTTAVNNLPPNTIDDIATLQSNLSGEIIDRQNADSILAANLTTLTNNAEVESNKTSDVETNKTSSTFYPTVKAIVDWITARYITISQSVAQTIGTTTQRLTKLWATDIESSNMPTVGGVPLSTTLEQKSNKTSDIYTNRQSTTYYPTVKGIADYVDSFLPQTWVLSFRKTGDGTGIAQITITSNIDSTVTITNGYLYTDSAGNGQTTSINLTHNVATNIYFKATQSNGFLIMKNIVNFSSVNPPSNAPIFYFSVNSFPKTLTSFQWWYNNAGGGDIAFLPYGVTIFNWGASNTGTGDIANLPAGLTSVQWWGNNTGSGNIANLPAGITSFSWGGNNTGTGDIANLPAGLTYLNWQGYNTGTGNMYNLPAGVTFIDLEGKNTITFTDSTQSPKVWASGMRKVYLRPSTGVFTSAMTDALLISLSGQSSWTNEKLIDLRGNCGARTSASDSAVSKLQGYGVTVLTN